MPTEQGTEIARYEMQGLVTHAAATRARAALTDPRADERAALVQGLRDLADFYEEHTELALPEYPDFMHGLQSFVGFDAETGPAELARFAEALDVEVTKNGTHHLDARKMFGAVEFHAYFIIPKPTAAQVAAAILQPDAECE